MSDINWHTPTKKQEYYDNHWYLLDIDGDYFLSRFSIEADGVGYWTIDGVNYHLPYRVDKFAMCGAIYQPSAGGA